MTPATEPSTKTSRGLRNLGEFGSDGGFVASMSTLYFKLEALRESIGHSGTSSGSIIGRFKSCGQISICSFSSDETVCEPDSSSSNNAGDGVNCEDGCDEDNQRTWEEYQEVNKLA